MKVYACGPISGTTYKTCTSWRDRLRAELLGVAEVVSPLRGKDYLEADKTLPRYASTNHAIGRVLSSPKAILARDFWDVQRCNVVFANLMDTTCVSIGSVMEVAMAHVFQIPIVGVVDENHDHPFVTECITHQCDDLEIAYKVCRRLF